MGWCRQIFSWSRRLAKLKLGYSLQSTSGKIAALVSVFAGLSLVYLLGAAAMYFRLPTSVCLTKAFMGAEDWSARTQKSLGVSNVESETPQVNLDRKEMTCDGYTLCMNDLVPQADLIDMRGKIVHQWKANTRMAWPRAARVQGPLPDEPVHWDYCHVYPDGALLALCSRLTDSYGYGLMKLDKESNLLWAYSENIHHDFTVADDGRIYVITYRLGAPSPPELRSMGETFRAEDLVELSADGQPLRTFPLYEAFNRSNFALLFETQLGRRGGETWVTSMSAHSSPFDSEAPGDILHTNSVKILPKSLAAKFPQFKPGWALLSFRNSSIIALLDPDERKIVWAAIGPWRGQHDAQFLANGHLLIFDNLGAGNGPRVLEYDPVSQGIFWMCSSVDFRRPIKQTTRGACQRLPNGNTLVSELYRCVFEVTPNKKTVWESTVPGHLRSRRYFPEELPFLPPGTTPR